MSRHESRGGDPLIGPGGKVDPGALFRAAAVQDKDNAPSSAVAKPTAPSPAEPGEGRDDADDGDILAVQPPRKQKVSFTLTRDLEKRLDKYLVDRITFLSRNKLQELIDAGCVTVNGRVAKSSTKLRIDDVVEVLIDAPPSEDYPPQDIPLDVMYEDEHMIVLNKSPDIIVHPARTHTEGTMINALAYHFRHRSKSGGSLSGVGGEFARPGVVHRLDRQTSGVIVFAKSDTAHWKLAEQFEKRSTDKRYIAFVHGKVEPMVDVIDVPIGPHPSREKGFREKQVVRHDHLGKPAVSVYRVLGRYRLGDLAPAPAAVAKKKRGGWTTADEPETAAPTPSEATMGRDSPWVSIVEVELKTGRTHQIRVHFQHRQHPLLADDMYEGRVIEAAIDAKKSGRGSKGSASVPSPTTVTIKRVALHAAMLKIKHPITGKPMEFVAPLPPDLKALLSGLRRSGGEPDEPANPPGAVLTLAELAR